MVEAVFAVVFVLIIALFVLAVFAIGNYRNRWIYKFEKDIKSENEPEEEGKDND